MLRATELAHIALDRCLAPGDWAVDATAGNGHDTAWLAQRVGEKGRVFAFDVQEAAITAATARVRGLPQVTLIHAGHERLSELLPPQARGQLAGVMFNLGYLPGGSKDLITHADTTLAALEQALAFLKQRGLITLVLYPGHPGGADEAAAVRSFVHGLPPAFSASHFARITSVGPAPELLIIERVA